MPRYVIALDVGGTSVKSGIVSDERVIHHQQTTSIDSGSDADTILNAFAGVIETHLQQVTQPEVSGIAFGMPGPFDYETGVSWIKGIEKFDSLYGLNIITALRSKLNLSSIPIRLRNDAEAAIIGEYKYGAGRSYQRGIGLTLGTGFGTAFVIDGVPQTSARGIPPNGWLYAEPWQGQRADDCFSIRGFKTLLSDIGQPDQDPKSAANIARQGNHQIQQIFAQFGQDLGAFLMPYLQAFEAEAILVLGGMAGAFDLFGQALEATVSIPVLPGALGQNAALFGASDLIFYEG